MNIEQALRRSVSALEMDPISKDHNLMIKRNEVERVECECCGMSEDYTPSYIDSIKELYCGKWVCGLCSEAVKEHHNRNPTVPMNEVLDSHLAFCQKFNRTRLNPKLSLAAAMRDIAKRSSQHKNSSKNLPIAKIARSTSCDPRIGIRVQKLSE